jgi:hypothetical protein
MSGMGGHQRTSRRASRMSALLRRADIAAISSRTGRTCRLICPTGKSLNFLSSPSRKNIPLHRLLETALLIRPSRPTEGRFAIVTNVGQGMRWTRQHRRNWVFGLRSADERCWCVRRSRVVLTPRRWRQVGGQPPMTVAKEPGHRGARRKPLKPLRGECRVFPV